MVYIYLRIREKTFEKLNLILILIAVLVLES